MHPADPVAAATHSDPIPYYRQLQAGPALVFDASLRLWVASRAEVIEEIFANPDCVVRPPAEPVPRAIAGSSAGAVFGALARMNEGAAHANARRTVSELLTRVDPQRVAQLTARLAQDPALPQAPTLNAWMFALPTSVVACLLGFREAELAPVSAWVAEFVQCLSPLSGAAQLEAASHAAAALMARFAALEPPGTAAATLANLLGLLSQTHEATAGLIGNSIVALLRSPTLLHSLRRQPALAAELVAGTARTDPSVQNTRRFVARATIVAGVALAPGDTLLLLLGAVTDRTLGFGHGRHACPGQAIALTIATAALQHLLTLPQPLDAATLHWRYRPSANARLPLFFDQ